MPDVELRDLPYMLTEEEQRARGVDLAHAIQFETDAIEEKADTAKIHRDRVEAATKEVQRLAEIVRLRREDRPTACDWMRDEERGLMVLRREDSGEIVESRPMTNEERQRELFKKRTKAAERTP